MISVSSRWMRRIEGAAACTWAGRGLANFFFLVATSHTASVVSRTTRALVGGGRAHTSGADDAFFLLMGSPRSAGALDFLKIDEEVGAKAGRRAHARRQATTSRQGARTHTG